MIEWELLALALAGGIIRISPVLIWVVLGDCVTQRSGFFNLGLEGIIPCGAVAAVWAAGFWHDPWLGVAAGMAAGAAVALLIGLCCMLARIDTLAIGIAFLVGGHALANFSGAGVLAVQVEPLPSLDLGAALGLADDRGLLRINYLLPAGLVAALALAWALRATRAGLLVAAAGAASRGSTLRLLGIDERVVRLAATMFGGACGGIGGASLALFYPGGWSEQLTTGVGIVALTLVFLVRSRPLPALAAALVFAACAALGPALQVALGTGSYHLFNALPYIAALAVLIGSGRRIPAGS